MQIRAPQNPDEFEHYYRFRHRLLRGPWGQPPGSERDELDAAATHAMACADDGNVIGVGRLHFNSPEEAQVRYMAVDEDSRGQGIGRTILQYLEQQARNGGARRVVLNARTPAARFYQHCGYQVTGDAPTLFGTIAHVHMEKDL